MVVSHRCLYIPVLLLVCCLLLAGCQRTQTVDPASTADPVAEPAAQGQPEPQPEPVYQVQLDAQPQPEPEPEPVYQALPDAEPVYEVLPDAEPQIQYPNPLTGLELGSPAAMTARPIAVMLNDIQAALPQYGNSQADVIVEIVAEGGITRMIALYQDVTGIPQIGSVRSTRPYYIDVVQGFDAILIHCGGSTDAYSLLRSRGIDRIDGIYTSAIFWRDQERANRVGSEHSLFTSGELIQAYLAESGFRLEHGPDYSAGLSFAPDGTPEGGSPALQVNVPMSGYKSTVFNYDAALGKYLVSQFDAPYTDGQDDSQVGITNVLVLYTSVSGTGDVYGHMTAQTTGSGTGLFCCGGQAAEIAWTRGSTDQGFRFTRSDGSELTLGRGTSYVCIVSNSSAVTVQ